MKVIQITDNDADALVEKLELQKGRHFTRWRSLHEEISPAAQERLIQDVHRHFHYEVVKWLQKHGARLS